MTTVVHSGGSVAITVPIATAVAAPQTAAGPQ